MKILNKILYILGVALIFNVSVAPSSVKALENGAYIVPIEATYANPETGKTADGGTEIQTGQSMLNKMVTKQALLECENGKYYLTLRIGMMDFVSNTEFTVQTSSGGGYENKGYSQTVSRSDNNGTKDLRFEIINPDLYIMPKLYVTKMHRDVQFFVKVNASGATPGTGDFVSQISTNSNNNSNNTGTSTGANSNSSNGTNNEKKSGGTVNSSQGVGNNTDGTTDAGEVANEEAENTPAETPAIIEKSEEAKKEAEAKKAEIENESINDVLEDVKGITEYTVTSAAPVKNESKNIGMKIGIVAVLVVAAVAGGFVFYRKKFNKVG